MPYSAEVVRRARQSLAQRKADKESEYHQHLYEAYGAVPRLREIDLELRRSMTLAAQTVFTQGGDAYAAMEQVKQVLMIHNMDDSDPMEYWVAMNAMYSDATMKSDIVQISHHAFNNLRELYSRINAPIALVPNSEANAKNSQWGSFAPYSSSIYCADAYTFAFEMKDGKVIGTRRYNHVG